MLVVHPAINSSRSPGMPRRDRVGRHTRPVTWAGRGRRPPVVRLSADHGGVWLWYASPAADLDHIGSIDPDDVGISPALQGRLATWVEESEATSLGLGSPTGTGYAEWLQRGRRLAPDLHKEVGSDVRVLFEDERDEP